MSNVNKSDDKESDGTDRSGEGAVLYDELTVFQAAPFVWKEKSSDGEEDVLHPIELNKIDFEKERIVLTKALAGSEQDGVNIKLTFEVATTTRLNNFLTTSKAQVIHFSCHGTKTGYLCLEDGEGGAHFLSPDHLKNIFAGCRELRLVFLSACNSEKAGEAFIEAGVPFVICCETDKLIEDTAAIEFCRQFYPAIACDTLKSSFEAAQRVVGILAKEEVEKFKLLSRNGDADVKIFFGQQESPSANSATRDNLVSLSHLPLPPRPFIGREVDTYNLLRKVLEANFIKLKGGGGFGKNSIAAHAAHYICAREHSFCIDEVIWLPLRGTSQQNALLSPLSDLCNILQDRELSRTLKQNNNYIKSSSELFESLQKRSILFVIDSGLFLHTGESLQIFLGDIYSHVQDAKVLLICREGFDDALELKQSLVETEMAVGPLDFENAAILFGMLCPHILEKRSQARATGNFAELVSPTGQCDAQKNTKGSYILKATGEGIPGRICRAAKEMTPEDVDKLIKFAGRSEEELDGLLDISTGPNWKQRVAGGDSGDVFKQLRECLVVRDFVSLYDSDHFQQCLQRLEKSQGTADPEVWAKQWAMKMRRSDPEAVALNKDRKLCLELLYKLCDRWKHAIIPTVSKSDIVKDFEARRIERILTRCVVMDRAQALYSMIVPASTKYGMHWVAKRHIKESGEWKQLMDKKNYKGFPTINKRLFWLMDIDGLGLEENKLLKSWLEPKKASFSSGHSLRFLLHVHVYSPFLRWKRGRLPESPSTKDDMLKQVRDCRVVRDFVYLYHSDSFQQSLRRLETSQGTTDPEYWAKRWAFTMQRGDRKAVALNKDRELCSELLYELCDRWKDDNPTVSKEDIVVIFKTRRIERILARCVVMDRARALYSVRNPASTKYGTRWVSKRHVQEPGKQKQVTDEENRVGHATMNKQLFWLMDIDELGLKENELLKSWLEPEKTSFDSAAVLAERSNGLCGVIVVLLCSVVALFFLGRATKFFCIFGNVPSAY